MKKVRTTRTWKTIDQVAYTPSFLRKMIRIDDSKTSDYQFGIVTRMDDFYAALEMVQNVYLQEGYVNKTTDPGPCRILKNHHHEQTAVFVGKKQDQIAFTVSLFPDSAWGLAMDAIYKDELDELRSQGRRIGEVGCLATHPEHRDGSQNILMHGNKIMLKYAMEQLELDDLVITVHPKHALIYEEVLMFEKIESGLVKNYPQVNNNPAVALRLDLHTAEDKFKRYYQNNDMQTNLHHFLFVKNSTNIDRLDYQTSETIFWRTDSYPRWAR